MKTFFPEMDREIAEDKLASRRERRQRAREYIAKNAGYRKFVLKFLMTKGPSLDINMALEMTEICGDPNRLSTTAMLNTMTIAQAMWTIGELWRTEFNDHPCREVCYTYGIKGVHTKHTSTMNTHIEALRRAAQ